MLNSLITVFFFKQLNIVAISGNATHPIYWAALSSSVVIIVITVEIEVVVAEDSVA